MLKHVRQDLQCIHVSSANSKTGISTSIGASRTQANLKTSDDPWDGWGDSEEAPSFSFNVDTSEDIDLSSMGL